MMGLYKSGEDNPTNKFKESVVRDICEMLQDGKTPLDIKYSYEL